MTRLFGLIGKPLAQSFSKKYFTEKFEREDISNTAYELFQLESIDEFPGLLERHTNFCGINVTIPYKREVMQYLHEVDETARAIGACNCIKVENGKLTGYNTDAPAFKASLLPLLQPYHNKALVLGTGGAAQAVVFILQQLGISYKYVSRKVGEGMFGYDDLTPDIMQEYLLIINTTPLGSFPKVEDCARIPYEYLTNRHYLYDLVYNPAVTRFLQNGLDKGASIKNGYDMLVAQAELGWEIWSRK
ncbi:MAG: shikimate dehydrogenase [Niabella sp.]